MLWRSSLVMEKTKVQEELHKHNSAVIKSNKWLMVPSNYHTIELTMFPLYRDRLLKRMSDYSLTPYEQYFSNIKATTSYISAR